MEISGNGFGRYETGLLCLGMMHFHFGHPNLALERLVQFPTSGGIKADKSLERRSSLDKQYSSVEVLIIGQHREEHHKQPLTFTSLHVNILREGIILLGVQAYLAGFTFALAASPCSPPVLAGYPSGICCCIQGSSDWRQLAFNVHNLLCFSFTLGCFFCWSITGQACFHFASSQQVSVDQSCKIQMKQSLETEEN
ncbi:Anaphase-promoting complex subunit 5 [Spatholobus suberectus]|nr:Anaphase-promoting complex subunit 5 [Spatholobus suberectus]